MAGPIPHAMTTTGPVIDGYRSTRTLGIVRGITVRSRSVLGTLGARLLGATLASFVGLAEVLFAVAFAWLFIGQVPTVLQAIGGVVVVAGVALVRLGELRAAAADAQVLPVEEPVAA